LQPYHIKESRLAQAPWSSSFELNGLLMIVGRLDNVDKHSILLPTVTIAQFRQPTFRNLRRAELRPPGPWVYVEDGAVFCELIGVVPLDPSREVEVQAEPPVTVVFGDPANTHDPRLWEDRRTGAASIADLFAAADAVETIIGRFIASFDHDAPP
jgi:hypothetical protein